MLVIDLAPKSRKEQCVPGMRRVQTIIIIIIKKGRQCKAERE